MKKILIANRGEIAVRVIRTCREMGLATVAVYSECDRTALHVRLADQAYAIGPNQASESYLRIDKLIDVARAAKVDGVHPGYGFLAENAEFADACSKAGVTFIGPTAKAMRALGSKTRAREIAMAAGVPVVPGTDKAVSAAATESELIAAASQVTYPLLVKAVAGGGGKGMRVVRSEHELAAAVRAARSEARSAFGDDAIYFERLVERPRHVEVQLLGDAHGTVLPFVERECSIQRRHQKVIEETPSTAVDPGLRARLAQAATMIGQAAGYTSAGTVEFLLDGDGHYYFLEMNTRLQVEHPITESVTGIDFVRAQIDIANGLPLGYDPERLLTASGHAIECRVYAEDPDEGFLPSPGVITHLRPPSGPGIRDDGSVAVGGVVPTYYDSLVSKVIAWSPDRPGAIARLIRALSEYDLRGIKTTIGFCRELLSSPAFAAGDFDTTTIDRLLEGRRNGNGETPPDAELEELAAIAAAFAAQDRLAIGGEPKKPGIVAQSASLWEQRARLESLR
ncbi:MAG: ATP-grasp domain-containing protein [Vicinamibacterales bacterium]|nr:ATP-grasp domain-containing protein [Vicinamibacterales bacterium]